MVENGILTENLGFRLHRVGSVAYVLRRKQFLEFDMKSDFALKTLDAKYAKKYQVTYMLWILNALKMSFENVKFSKTEMFETNFPCQDIC